MDGKVKECSFGDMKLILEALYPGVVEEHRFHPKRRWRFDYAWPDKMIAFELEGGNWIRGRHTRGKGYENDCEKYSEAAILGWKVIRATPSMMKTGLGYSLLAKAMLIS